MIAKGWLRNEGRLTKSSLDVAGGRKVARNYNKAGLKPEIPNQ